MSFSKFRTPEKVEAAVKKMGGRVVGSYTAQSVSNVSRDPFQTNPFQIIFDIYMTVSLVREKGGRWLRHATITKKLRSSQIAGKIEDYELKCCLAVAEIQPREGAPIHEIREGYAIDVTQAQDMKPAEMALLEKKMKTIRNVRNSDGSFT